MTKSQSGICLTFPCEETHFSHISLDHEIHSQCEDSIGSYSYISNDFDDYDHSELVLDRHLRISEVGQLSSFYSGNSCGSSEGDSDLASILTDDFECLEEKDDALSLKDRWQHNRPLHSDNKSMPPYPLRKRDDEIRMEKVDITASLPYELMKLRIKSEIGWVRIKNDLGGAGLS